MPKRVIHLACAAACDRHIDGPPDPDSWGNRRVTIECRECGERGTLTVSASGPSLLSEGFAYDDSIEWTVDLPA